MKAFLITFFFTVTLLGLSNSQRCNSSCNHRSDPHCGITADCLVPGQNLCTLGYNACLLNLYHLSPIIDVMPGECDNSKPLCPGGFGTYVQSSFSIGAGK